MNPSIYIIAEAGVNHNGELDLAKRLVDVAVEARADAVKFQTFTAEKLATAKAGMAAYQKRNTGKEESQLAMLKRLELSRENHFFLADYCRDKGITFLSSPFDMDSLDFLLNEMKLPFMKVPSGELTNGPYLLTIARSGSKAVVSTGMAEMDEIAQALDVLAWGYLGRSEPASFAQMQGIAQSAEGLDILREKVILLHCTTEYPAAYDSINLRAMKTLKEHFGLPVGLSDHSEGIAVPIAGAALGALLIEKHITLDKSLPGPDHKASLDPAELTAMVAGVRAVEQALGTADKRPSEIELQTRLIARKSLVAKRAITTGTVLTPDDLEAKRPGSGASPMFYWELLGKRATRDYQEGDEISL